MNLFGAGVRSVPVHCLIEQFQQSVGEAHNTASSGHLAPVENDTYAIISSTTLFSEIVKTVLLKLGYSLSEATGAKGSIQIQNWKPLPFEAISPSPDCNVGDILGHLTNIATLRIKIFRERLSAPLEHLETSHVSVVKQDITKRVSPSCSSSALEVKEKLLQILLAQSQTLLLNEGCPIDHNNTLDLRILESLHILKNRPKLNDNISAFPLLVA
ncbi:DNA-binding protein SATB2 [Nymphon striatum]|nr:DNA-binding protein SATB2 [Nymphon striatum]